MANSARGSNSRVIEIDATLCECLTVFHNFTEQEFGGSFASFVTFMDRLLTFSSFFAIQASVMLCFYYTWT
jgi:hypothetical protein